MLLASPKLRIRLAQAKARVRAVDAMKVELEGIAKSRLEAAAKVRLLFNDLVGVMRENRLARAAVPAVLGGFLWGVNRIFNGGEHETDLDHSDIGPVVTGMEGTTRELEEKAKDEIADESDGAAKGAPVKGKTASKKGTGKVAAPDALPRSADPDNKTTVRPPAPVEGESTVEKKPEVETEIDKQYREAEEEMDAILE